MGDLRTRVQDSGPPALRNDPHDTVVEPKRTGNSVVFFIWAFAGIFTMLCAWTFATPLGAAPDEPAHTTQAVAIVRGQFDERQVPVGKTSSIAFVRVPCWVDNPWLRTQFSGCTRPHATTGLAPTEFSNYPPLYYVFVGLPSLLVSGNAAIYTMRVTGDVLNAVLIAIGIWLLFRYYPRRTPLIGVLVALSPMVLFMMSVLNDSGLEIAA